MSFQVSPGVEIKEVDLTAVIPAVSVSIGGIAGSFGWGPVEEATMVSDENQLAKVFGKPDSNTFRYFMPAAQFLQYAQTLKVSRTNNDGQLNSTPNGSGLLVKNRSHYESLTYSVGEEFVAKYPGELGNSIGVYVATSETAFAHADFTTNGYDQLFSGPPGTSVYAENKGISDDEMHIVVVDTNGKWTGTPNTVLEYFSGLSQAADARTEDGSSNYYVEVINRSSQYVWAGFAPGTLSEAGLETSDSLPVGSDGKYYTTSATVLSYVLTGGTIGTSAIPSVGELQTAYDVFQDPEVIDVSFLIGTDYADSADAVTMANYLFAMAQARRDCVAYSSPAAEDTVNNLSALTDVLAWANQITSTSYGVMDSSALYVYDKYNDVYRWIVASGATAGLSARTDRTNDPWYSPAGLNRGQYMGITKIAFNPRKSERDSLYKARVNPIVAFPGQGTVLYGDKTALAKPSAFDRINVRRLFIVLQKAIATAAKYQLFEFNDEFTRAQFRNMTEPYLREVQGRRGVIDFRVVCDDTNNTAQVIDTNGFVADIYIKPSRSINYITLSFVAVRTGVEFSEIVGG